MSDPTDINVVIGIVWDPSTGKIDIKCEGPEMPIHYQYFDLMLKEVFRLIKIRADEDGMLFSSKKPKHETEEDVPLWIRKVVSDDIN